MEELRLAIEKRTEQGSAACRRLRRSGRIPGVIYSHGDAALPIDMPRKEFVHMAERARSTQVFRFESSDPELDGRHGLVKEVQQDFVKHEVLHVDFRELRAGEVLQVEVPVHIVGESVGVKDQGGLLRVALHEISVNCAPANIPSLLQIDISNLALGEHITAGELPLPAGVELAIDADEVVVNVAAPRAESDESAEEETAESVTTSAEVASSAPKGK